MLSHWQMTMIKNQKNGPEWRRVKFGDVVRLSKVRCSDPLAEGVERYVGMEHLEPGDLRIRNWGNVADGVTFTSVFQTGQVLFGKRRAYQRKVAVADFSGVCSGDIYVLETKDEKVLLPKLLPFICQTEAFFNHAVGTSAGSLSPRTNWTSLADFEFLLPPLSEQSKISELFTSIDDTCEQYRMLIESMSRVQKAILSEDLRKNWGKKKIAEVATVITGKTPPTSKTDCWAADIPFATPGDLELDTGKLSCIERSISEIGSLYSKVVPKGATLVVCIGSTIGKVAQTTCRTAFNQQINAVVCHSVDADYFYAVSTTIGMELSKRSGTTAVPIINKGEFESIEIPVPPNETQIEIAKRFDEFSNSRRAALLRLNDFKKLRNEVIQDYVGN